MLRINRWIMCVVVSTLTISSCNAEEFSWPNNAKVAVSLSYDDALNSQLDNAIPVLNQYGFKASFYLTLSSSTVKDRLSEWRTIAKQGHELGNHSINHSCSASSPDRNWVPKHNDLDKKYFYEIVREIHTANAFLTAIDGQSIRTFTVPCTDQMVENRNYVEALHEVFVGIKSHLGSIPTSWASIEIMDMPVWTPVGSTGKELIAYAQQAAKHGTIANYTFHGIGGDHLSVSSQAHQQLLQYLNENNEIYWVDTFRNISLYVKKNHD